MFTTFRNIFSSLPVKLIIIIVGTIFFGDFIDETIKSIFLAISMCLREILLFLLPIIIFFLVFSSFSQISNKIISFIILLLCLVCLSNFSALMFAYPVIMITQDLIVPNTVNTPQNSTLEPYLFIELPKICSNLTALIIAAVFGIYTSTTNSQFLQKIAQKGFTVVNKFLRRIFIPILPLFILGFILKIDHDKILTALFKNCIPLISITLVIYLIYIGTLYLTASKFNIHHSLKALKNMFPSVIVAFSAMSSAVAMPVSINGITKNVKNKDIPLKIIPLIVNVHMIGGSLAIPLMAASLYKLEYGQLPPINEYIIFAISFVFAKFACAAIPGGTILVAIPILESTLHFTGEMSSMILTTYLLLDPICTSGNILANGSFVMLFEKLRIQPS